MGQNQPPNQWVMNCNYERGKDCTVSAMIDGGPNNVLGTFLIVSYSVAYTTLAVVAPLSLVVYQSFLTAPFFDRSAHASLAAFSFVFADADFWQAFWTTITIAGGMAAIAVPLPYPASSGNDVVIYDQVPSLPP